MNAMSYPLLDHLIAMTDDTGLIQHATHDIPNRSTGYCTDDIARALVVAVTASCHPAIGGAAGRLVTTYLSYLHDAQMPDGWFHNFMGYDRTWQDRRGTPDAFGRALWGLGWCARYAPRKSWRELAMRLMRSALPHVAQLEHHRSRAYAVLGLRYALDNAGTDGHTLRAALRCAIDPIVQGCEQHSDASWTWCEPMLSYDNGRLPQALLIAGEALDDPGLIEIGLRLLAFYVSIVFEDGMFVPIGNDGWYRRGGQRARYGQQPIEAAAMIDAALAAFAATGDGAHQRHAEAAFGWFFGQNTAGATLVANGGCCDGIDGSGVNPNMGAESTLAYLQSAMAIAKPAIFGGVRLQVMR